MCKRHVLPQIAQITQRECSFAALFRRERQVVVNVVLGFVCVNQRDLRETLGFFCDRLSTLACYSPADYADHAEKYSKAVLFRRERQVDVCIVFGVSL